MSQNLSRQQIYDRIKASSKDNYILEEMKRLGFWEETSTPSLPEQLIQKEAILQKELQELIAKNRKYEDQEEMLREMRKKRMQEAKAKREITKRENEKNASIKLIPGKNCNSNRFSIWVKMFQKGFSKRNPTLKSCIGFHFPFLRMYQISAGNQDLASLRSDILLLTGMFRKEYITISSKFLKNLAEKEKYLLRNPS
uniref:Uncharacterized protein n=1 Tax=Chryseobacterium endophyticum TaxID=1854762 RepID=A0AAU6WR94_9FLAO